MILPNSTVKSNLSSEANPAAVKNTKTGIKIIAIDVSIKSNVNKFEKTLLAKSFGAILLS